MPDIKAQNQTALASVKAIYDAAEEANTLLDGMQTAAEQAGTTLNGIYQDAKDAQQSASDAQESADNARSSASAALDQLSVVENVVGVLKLLSTNAEYQLTNDTEISEGKWYFTRSGYAGGSYSGSIATFETTAGDNIESLVVDIEPIQSGSGTPSPTNVRPISGRTEVVTHRTGKNLLTYTETHRTISGVSIDISADGVLHAYGTAREALWVAVGEFEAKGGKTYFYGNLPRGMSTTTYFVTRYGSKGNTYEDSEYTFANDTNAVSRFYVRKDVTLDVTFKLVVADADTAQTYTTALGRTVYGGTLDVVSGVLTVDMAMVDLSTTWNWRYASGSGGYFYTDVSNFSGLKTHSAPITNRLKTVTSGSEFTANTFCVYCASNVNFKLDSNYTTANSFKTWLTDNPIQVCYELATPQTYQLTPQQVATLLGVNNVWADCGSVSVAVKSTYSYAVVTNPVIADIANYYEIVSIDEAVQDYVVSRLAVTSAGLWVQDPNMNTKILLSSTDGVVIYGPTGKITGKYGSTAQVGDASSFHIEMDGTELGFYQGSQRVAYINNNQLYITQSVVLQQMDLGIPVANGGLGQWSWKVHPNGQNPQRNNLNLKWIG